MPRRSILVDKDKKQRLLNHILQGNYIEPSCIAEGIHPSTFYNWQRWAEEYANNPNNGNEHKKIYFEFFEELKRAEAKAEVELVGVVKKASDKPQYWAAGMTMLERRHRDRWGRQDQPIVESKVLIALQDSFSQLKHVAKGHLDDVKQIPQGGVTEKEGDEE